MPKAMKTKKTLTLVIVFLMMTGLTFAGETAIDMAKKELCHEITECFNRDIKHWNNYFYQNGINRIEEKVKVCFIVNGDQSLSIIRISCEDGDAENYVKHIFKTRKVKADKILVGKAYTFNLRLKYIAR